MADDKETKEPSVHQDARTGRFLPGNSAGGRKKGSLSIHSKKSVIKLQELGLDPVVELVALYDQAVEQENSDLAFKIMARLIDFGYSRQAAVVETKVEGAMPVMNITRMPVAPQDEENADE